MAALTKSLGLVVVAISSQSLYLLNCSLKVSKTENESCLCSSFSQCIEGRQNLVDYGVTPLVRGLSVLLRPTG